MSFSSNCFSLYLIHTYKILQNFNNFSKISKYNFSIIYSHFVINIKGCIKCKLFIYKQPTTILNETIKKCISFSCLHVAKLFSLYVVFCSFSFSNNFSCVVIIIKCTHFYYPDFIQFWIYLLLRYFLDAAFEA